MASDCRNLSMASERRKSEVAEEELGLKQCPSLPRRVTGDDEVQAQIQDAVHGDSNPKSQGEPAVAKSEEVNSSVVEAQPEGPESDEFFPSLQSGVDNRKKSKEEPRINSLALIKCVRQLEAAATNTQEATLRAKAHQKAQKDALHEEQLAQERRASHTLLWRSLYTLSQNVFAFMTISNLYYVGLVLDQYFPRFTAPIYMITDVFQTWVIDQIREPFLTSAYLVLLSNFAVTVVPVVCASFLLYALYDKRQKKLHHDRMRKLEEAEVTRMRRDGINQLAQKRMVNRLCVLSKRWHRRTGRTFREKAKEAQRKRDAMVDYTLRNSALKFKQKVLHKMLKDATRLSGVRQLQYMREHGRTSFLLWKRHTRLSEEDRERVADGAAHWEKMQARRAVRSWRLTTRARKAVRKANLRLLRSTLATLYAAYEKTELRRMIIDEFVKEKGADVDSAISAPQQPSPIAIPLQALQIFEHASPHSSGSQSSRASSVCTDDQSFLLLSPAASTRSSVALASNEQTVGGTALTCQVCRNHTPPSVLSPELQQQPVLEPSAPPLQTSALAPRALGQVSPHVPTRQMQVFSPPLAMLQAAPASTDDGPQLTAILPGGLLPQQPDARASDLAPTQDVPSRAQVQLHVHQPQASRPPSQPVSLQLPQLTASNQPTHPAVAPSVPVVASTTSIVTAAQQVVAAPAPPVFPQHPVHNMAASLNTQSNQQLQQQPQGQLQLAIANPPAVAPFVSVVASSFVPAAEQAAVAPAPAAVPQQAVHQAVVAPPNVHNSQHAVAPQPAQQQNAAAAAGVVPAVANGGVAGDPNWANRSPRSKHNRRKRLRRQAALARIAQQAQAQQAQAQAQQAQAQAQQVHVQAQAQVHVQAQAQAQGQG